VTFWKECIAISAGKYFDSISAKMKPFARSLRAYVILSVRDVDASDSHILPTTMTALLIIIKQRFVSVNTVHTAVSPISCFPRVAPADILDGVGQI
jgi:hypothetical protein